MESILNSIKKLLGVPEHETHFDPDITMHINSVFAVLTNQLGVGPESGFSISDDLNTWFEFSRDESIVSVIKPYIYLKVRLLFDPPSSSFVLAAIEKSINELEWRITNMGESK